MLIIDERAASKLLAALSTYRQLEEDARYILFTLEKDCDAQFFHETITKAAKQHASNDDGQLFFLESGDVCLLSNQLHSSVANPLIDAVCAALNKPCDTSWLIYQKLANDHYGITEMIRSQIEAEQLSNAQVAEQKEQQKHEMRRKTILGGGSKSQAIELNQRRRGRDTRKIMIIEDDAFSRKLVSNAIKKQFETVALEDASHALDMYTGLAPDMLLLDINLPDVTGHELLERIIALDPDAYVVMLSGNADATNIKQAMSKGASGFIGKPFSKEKLFQYIYKCPTIDKESA